MQALTCSVALRGAWATEDNFVMEFYVVGEAERGTQQWRFAGDTVRILHRESIIGELATFTADRVG